MGIFFTALGASCAQPGENAESVGNSAQPLTETPIDTDHAKAEIAIAWTKASYGETLAAASGLGANLTNNTAETKDVRLSLVSSGLDGRLV